MRVRLKDDAGILKEIKAFYSKTIAKFSFSFPWFRKDFNLASLIFLIL